MSKLIILITKDNIEKYLNLIFIAPNKVSGLAVKKLQQFDDNIKFEVSWDKSEFSPDNYTLLIAPLDNFKKPITMNLSGVSVV